MSLKKKLKKKLKRVTYGKKKLSEIGASCFGALKSNVKGTTIQIPKDFIRKHKTDILYCGLMYDITPEEYYMYRFEEKGEDLRKEFISLASWRRAAKKQVNDISNKMLLKDKYLCYEKFIEFYRRDIAVIQSLEDFQRFFAKHPNFIAKPTALSYGGDGIFVINEKIEDPVAFYQEKLENKGYLLEELIKQQGIMAEFHPESVNTIRIVTYNYKEEVSILFAIVRMGCGCNVVDNACQGGICAMVDPENGKIISAGKRRNREEFKNHPDTGTPIEGAQIPEWDQLVEMAKKASGKMEDPRMIGWDFAYGEQGWTVIEANWLPAVTGVQMCAGKGMRSELSEKMDLVIL